MQVRATVQPYSLGLHLPAEDAQGLHGTVRKGKHEGFQALHTHLCLRVGWVRNVVGPRHKEVAQQPQEVDEIHTIREARGQVLDRAPEERELGVCQSENVLRGIGAVSYTHLTLPTN